MLHYDLGGWDRKAVTPALIKSTRRPWMGSRISREQERWFIHRAASAPWGDVPIDAQFVDADPVESGEL